MSEKPLFSRGKYTPLASESALPKDLQGASFEGGLLVLGSPGSGKTSLLRLIAREQITRLGANAVLAVTPDRQSAALRRDELILDSLASSAGPRARSLTGLAFWILDQTALTNGESRPKLLSGANQQELVASLISSAIAQGKEKNWKLPKATLQLNGFVTELREQLTVFLEHQITPEALSKIAQEFPNLRLGPALDIYPAYLEEIQRRGVLDTSQLLVRATEQIKADRSLVSDLKLLLIDDAQELTAAGFALLEELSSTINLVFFADPDATVLGFRGALGSKLSAELERVFPNLTRHTLETKHEIRSAEIAELMRRISNRIPVSLAGSQRKSLNQSVSKPESVACKVFPNSSQELDYLATEMRKTRLTESASWDDFVVVARTRPQLDAIHRGLVARGVPSRILGYQTALREQFAARSILNIALKILKPDLNDESLSSDLLQSPFCGLDSLGLRRLFRKLAHLERESDLVRSKRVLLAEVIETAAATDLDTPEFLKLKKLQTLIRSVREKPLGNGLELVSQIWENSGLATKWQELARGSSEVAAAANRDLDSVLELFAAAERYSERNPAASAFDFVSYQLEVAVPEDSLAPLGYSPSVSLSTPSALLGARYRFGFLPRLQDGIWPNLRTRGSLLGATAIDEYLKGNSTDPSSLSRTELSEELRLLYKAVGSVTERIYFTAMQSLDEQPSQFFNILFSQVPAVENYEREFDLRNRVGRLRIAVQSGDERAALELATLARAGVAGADPSGWYGVLGASSDAPLVDEGELVVVNPSKLDAFAKCPLHWFVASHGGDGSGFEASLGTLIHEALEKSLDKAENLQPTVDSLWHQLEFEAEWQEQAQRRKAQQMVLALVDYIENKSGELLASEAAFEFVVDKLQINGKVDRIERTENGIVVVDLKTGKVGTKEEVANNKQLALYQMAAKKVLTPGQDVVGARIISVDKKLSVPEQGPLEGKLLDDLNSLLESASREMSAKNLTAIVSDHCSGNATCSMLLVPQVGDHD